MTTTPPFWCDVCSLDLQSSKALEQHKTGRKHCNRAFQQNILVESCAQDQSLLARARSKYATFIQLDNDTPADELGEGLTELFEKIASGKFKKILVCTGAGVSVAAGVPDFRSPGGLFEMLRREFGDQFPQARDNPEWLLSRHFAIEHPQVWNEIMLPRIQADFNGLQPTLTHRFFAWLYQHGWLGRIYTQNVDGLHTHPSLNIPPDLVVECHGSMRTGNLVLYGDDLPQRVSECCNQDFPLNANPGQEFDLVLVFGTSLQVAPFCGIPNMVPKGCTRVLVNKRVQDCLRNDFTPRASDGVYGGFGGISQVTSARIGKRKNVPLRPLWNDSKANKKWQQLLVESESDEFVRRFFESLVAKELGHSLDE